MNKDIRFIPVDPELEKWLAEKLRDAPGESGEELRAGLEALRSGAVRSLLLSAAEETGMPREESGAIVVGELSIHLKSRRVILAGREVSLTPKEFDILYFLAENRGEVFTKEQIYKAVWSDAYLLDDSNIMAFIRKLRKKIEPDPDAPRYILTIWGVGYKFNDEV